MNNITNINLMSKLQKLLILSVVISICISCNIIDERFGSGEDKVKKWELTSYYSHSNIGLLLINKYSAEDDTLLSPQYFNNGCVINIVVIVIKTGWIFDHWEGDLTGTENPISISMDCDKSITAVFRKIQHQLSVNIIGRGVVYENANIGKNFSYDYGTNVELTALADEGWSFDHWEGDLIGSSNPKIITMDDNKTVTAVFKEADYETENVIIVVMDGARYSETWGDPSHQYIPYLADSMSKEGVINTKFYNNEETITTSGHIYMTTGVYQMQEGRSRDYPYYPSIFQYWNEDNATTSNMTWVIASKDKLEALGNCELSSWKDQYLPNTDCGINGFSTGYCDDNVTYNKAINILSTYRPNLVLVTFKEPDVLGHSGIWNDYLEGIKDIDKKTFDLWNFIKTDSHYKGKTTMFVTNDHGRHLDGVYTGFKDHGCQCDGCRHIYFYAYGPDFKENVVIDKKRELIDIPATISELLDFSMPSGQGKVMIELFK